MNTKPYNVKSGHFLTQKVSAYKLKKNTCVNWHLASPSLLSFVNAICENDYLYIIIFVLIVTVFMADVKHILFLIENSSSGNITP